MSSDKLSDDDLRLVRWLIAGHQNERDEDVQKLFNKCGRILESKTQYGIAQSDWGQARIAVKQIAYTVKNGDATLQLLMDDNVQTLEQYFIAPP